MTYLKFAPRTYESPVVDRNVPEWNPPVDIIEGADKYSLYLDVPGFDKEKISVTVKEGVLTASGERELVQPAETDTKYYRYFERAGNKFLRTFRLPRHADGEGVTGEYENGVLTITVPKQEDAKPHTVTIK